MNKLLIFSIVIIAIHTTQGMEAPKIALSEQVTYVQGLASNSAFFSENGWGREALGKIFAIPSVVFAAFPTATAELSLTAKIGNEEIGQRNCNWWHHYLKEIETNISKVCAQYPQENVLAYMRVIQRGLDVEKNELVPHFRALGIPLDLIAHNYGIMVLKNHEGRGVGTALQEESIKMLTKMGIKAIVCETTNKASARVMEKQCFTKFREFSYIRDFQINLDDFYTIWYKDLRN